MDPKLKELHVLEAEIADLQIKATTLKRAIAQERAEFKKGEIVYVFWASDLSAHSRCIVDGVRFSSHDGVDYCVHPATKDGKRMKNRHAFWTRSIFKVFKS